MSPTQRTLRLLRSEGWTAEVVERWNPHAKVRHDLFHCIDVLAIKPGYPPMGVQACAGPSHATRRTKAALEPKLIIWLAAGCSFAVWSWAKRGARGARKVWTVRRESVIGVEAVKEQAT